MKVAVGYPPESEERRILDRYVEGFDAERVDSYGIQAVAGPEELEALRRAPESVRVEPDVRAYITAIVRATRTSPACTLGASPRAGVALFKTARAMALLAGRDYVTPDDVKRMAKPVLRHRVQLAPDLQIEGVAADEAIDGVLEQVPAPR
jgi:MoxR-like ATPase